MPQSSERQCGAAVRAPPRRALARHRKRLSRQLYGGRRQPGKSYLGMGPSGREVRPPCSGRQGGLSAPVQRRTEAVAPLRARGEGCPREDPPSHCSQSRRPAKLPGGCAPATGRAPSQQGMPPGRRRRPAHCCRPEQRARMSAYRGPRYGQLRACAWVLSQLWSLGGRGRRRSRRARPATVRGRLRRLPWPCDCGAALPQADEWGREHLVAPSLRHARRVHSRRASCARGGRARPPFVVMR